MPIPDEPASARRARGGHLRAVEADEHDHDEHDGPDLEAVPDYPVGALAGPLRAFVQWAVADGLDAAAAGAAGLAALATVTGDAELALTSTFRVRPALWIVPIGGTGTGKSPALDQAFAPISDLYQAERDAWDSEAETCDGKDMRPKPRVPTLGDVTMPSAARWLKSTGGAGTLVYDELVTMLADFAAGDRGKLCEMWTARRPVHIQRVGDGGASNAIDIYVPRPVLSIIGMLTPDNIKELGKEGDGFRARWLVHLPTRRAELLDAGPQPDEWGAAIGVLYSARGQRRTWTLEGRARTLYEKARQRWAGMQDEALPQEVIEAGRKADTQCARIALVLAESLDPLPAPGGARPRKIPADAMRAAIAVTDYVMDCWRALPGSRVLSLTAADERMSGAVAELFAWLEGRPKGTDGLPAGEAARPFATRRDIQRARVGGAVTPGLLSAMLAAYDMRWPGNVVHVQQSGRGGNKRALYYFPKRAAQRRAHADKAVTVTASGAALPADSPRVAAGDGLGSVEESCHKEAVTATCDSFLVTASAVPCDSFSGVCSGCGGTLDAALVEAGLTTHGGDCG